MTAQQFKQACRIAMSDVDLGSQDIDVFWGFGLPDFKQVFVTLAQVARLIRCQCQYMSGGWDSEALQEIQRYGRNRFAVIDVD